jgi:hypothetical protein
MVAESAAMADERAPCSSTAVRSRCIAGSKASTRIVVSTVIRVARPASSAVAGDGPCAR